MLAFFRIALCATIGILIAADPEERNGICVERCDEVPVSYDIPACYKGCNIFKQLQMEGRTDMRSMKEDCTHICEKFENEVEQKSCNLGCEFARGGKTVTRDLWHLTKITLRRIYSGVTYMLNSIKITLMKIYPVITRTDYTASETLPEAALNSSDEDFLVEKKIHTETQNTILKPQVVLVIDGKQQNESEHSDDGVKIQNKQDLGSSQSNQEQPSNWQQKDKGSLFGRIGDSASTKNNRMPWYVVASSIRWSDDSPFLLAAFVLLTVILILIIISAIKLTVQKMKKHKEVKIAVSNLPFHYQTKPVLCPQDLKPPEYSEKLDV